MVSAWARTRQKRRSARIARARSCGRRACCSRCARLRRRRRSGRSKSTSSSRRTTRRRRTALLSRAAHCSPSTSTASPQRARRSAASSSSSSSSAAPSRRSRVRSRADAPAERWRSSMWRTSRSHRLRWPSCSGETTAAAPRRRAFSHREKSSLRCGKRSRAAHPTSGAAPPLSFSRSRRP